MADSSTVVASVTQSIDNNPVLGTIVLCGLMGLVGQGIRAAVGIKSSSTLQAQGATKDTPFEAAYFSLSLMIGFIAGILGGLAINAGNFASIDLSKPTMLLGLMAAGYAGTDFIENAFTNLLPRIGFTPGAPQTVGKPDGSADTKPAEQPTSKKSTEPDSMTTSDASTAAGQEAEPYVGITTSTSDLSDMRTQMSAMSSQVNQLHSALLLKPAAAPSIPGSTYPVWALKRDTSLAHAKYWQHIVEGAQTHQLPVSVILAIGSKESQWGRALRPQGPAGTGDFAPRNPAKWGHAMPTDGLGWGRGLMQIDWYSNDFAKTGNWRDARANILYGCELLAEKIKKFTDTGHDSDTALRCGVSAYNGMSGTHSPYANDVIARAGWIRSEGLDASNSSGAVAA